MDTTSLALVLVVLAAVVLSTAAGAGIGAIVWAWRGARRARVEGADRLQQLWELWARQAVRYVEELSARAREEDDLAMPSNEKLRLAFETLRSLATQAGVRPPDDKQADILVHGSLAAERALMTTPVGNWLDDIPVMTNDELTRAIQLDPSLYRPGDEVPHDDEPGESDGR